MSRSTRSIAFFVAIAAALLADGPLPAQTLTWGANGAGGSGQWDTTTVDWYNGSANVPWTNGDAAVFAGTAGTVSISSTITASQATFSTAGYLVQNGFLNGTSSGLTVQTDADATISSAIFGFGGSTTPFTKTGAGTLTVTSGSGPVFFNAINVANGELRYGSSTFLNSSAPYVLGNTASAALTFGMSTGTVAGLSGGGANGGVVRPNGTSGNFTLNIIGAGDSTYGGTLAGNGSAILSLQKSGTGTQTLTNASYSLNGTTTVSGGGKLVLSGPNGALPNISGLIVNAGGTFQLDNGTSVNQTRLSTSLPVTLNGGTLSFVGNAASQDVHQTVGVLNAAIGASAVSVTSAGNGVAQLIFDGNLQRKAGATVSFTGGGHITLTGASNTNGILGGHSTVGADWASVDAGGNVSAYTGYATDTTTTSNTDNLRVTTAGGTISLASVQQRNSLNLVNTFGGTTAALDLGANGSLTLASGGLLTSGSGPFVIQNGKLNSGDGELIVTNQSGLTISSLITTGAVTKSGAGTLVFTGANTYGGATTINQGTVQVSADANLGTGNALVLNGGMLQVSGSFASTKSLQGTGGTVNTAGYNVTFDSAGSTASFTKTGAGILTVTRQNGGVTVNGGTLRLTNLVGGNSTAVTLLSGRLEAGDNGLQSVTTLGSGVVLSPGQVGEGQNFTVNFLTLLTPTVVEFDLGSATRNDFLSINLNLTLSGTASPQLLFRFNNLGNLQTGTAYSLASLPSSQFGQFGAANFGLDPASTAAGYRGTFNVVNGTVNVTFSAVPEPSVPVAVLCGAFAWWAGRAGLRRRAAREKSAN